MVISYRVRALDRRLDYLAQYFSAIAIEGPKAVGKTETALRRVNTQAQCIAKVEVTGGVPQALARYDVVMLS